MLVRKTTFLLTSLAAVAALASLLGCGGDADFSNESLPAPAISQGVAVETCGSSGAVTLALDDLLTTVTTGAAGQAPVNRLEVNGTVSGLGTESVIVVVTPIDWNCPAGGRAEAVVAPDGTFNAVLDFGGQTGFRVTAIAYDGTVDDITCDLDADCLSALPGLAGSSNSLRVVLE